MWLSRAAGKPSHNTKFILLVRSLSCSVLLDFLYLVTQDDTRLVENIAELTCPKYFLHMPINQGNQGSNIFLTEQVRNMVFSHAQDRAEDRTRVMMQ